MLHLRVIAPAELRDPVIEALTDNPGVAHLVVHRGAALDPPGDEITADIAREAQLAVNLAGIVLAAILVLWVRRLADRRDWHMLT
jgi:hypothetical protein